MATSAPDCSLCRPRQLQATPLYRLVQTHYVDVRDGWEERCESRYGLLRGFTDIAVGA